jgi:hypothetical protein
VNGFGARAGVSPRGPRVLLVQRPGAAPHGSFPRLSQFSQLHRCAVLHSLLCLRAGIVAATMPTKRAAAEALVAASTEGRGLSADHRERIVRALIEDLGAASIRATNDQDRLAKLEVQMQVLQRAVLTLCRDGAVGRATKAVKDGS